MDVELFVDRLLRFVDEVVRGLFRVASDQRRGAHANLAIAPEGNGVGEVGVYDPF